VLAPHSSLRARVTPAGRGKGGDSTEQGGTKQGAQRPGLPRHVAMRWAQRLKRVFGIEIEACVRCGARLAAGTRWLLAGWGRLKVLFAPPKIPYSISRKNGNHLVCAQGLS